ncbi:PGSC2-like protein, partial [Mya arenaria]
NFHTFRKADDSACTAASGNCQEDSLHCSGSYVSGLCTGHATRRCCIPAGSGSCSNVHIVTRSQWGARPAKTHSTMHVPVNEFFIHHTETPACTDMTACKTRVRSIQNYHMDSNGWSDIGYSFLVGEDGNVYEGRAVKNLIACGIQLGKIRSTYRLYGHRDAGQTSCPGDRLYAEIQTWPHYSHAHP